MTTTTVTTQPELDAAIAAKSDVVYINSPSGVWLNLYKSGSSHVVAWGSSRVVAWDSSHVVAWDSSHVVAWGSSHVVARDSSHVVASKYVAVHLHSARADITGGVLIDLTKIDLNDATQWLEFHGVHVENGVAYVYKAVNDEWTTDRGVDYSPGSTPGAPDWKPTLECGNGLHFGATPLCSREYFREATKYVRVGVAAETLVPLVDKCKAPKVVVAAVEVDMYGHEVQPS